jgi:nitrile hydratase subunit beta
VTAGARFATGDRVTVRRMFPQGHIRTPRYIMGLAGEICRVVGAFPNPEELAYGRNGLPKKMLYRVRFQQAGIWPDYAGSLVDTLEIELYEHWLMPAPGEGGKPKAKSRKRKPAHVTRS